MALHSEEANPKTLEQLRLTEKRFTAFLNAQGEVSSAQELTSAGLRAFIFVRALFRWAYLEGLLPTNIAERVKAPKMPKKVIPSLNEEAVAMLLFDCGLRAGELTGLGLADVNRDFPPFRVQGKGDNERVMPIGYHTFRALCLWK